MMVHLTTTVALVINALAAADEVGATVTANSNPGCDGIYVLPLSRHPSVPMDKALTLCKNDCAQPGFTCARVATAYPDICACGHTPTPVPSPQPTPKPSPKPLIMYSCNAKTGQCAQDPAGTLSPGECIATCTIAPPTPSPPTPAPPTPKPAPPTPKPTPHPASKPTPKPPHAPTPAGYTYGRCNAKTRVCEVCDYDPLNCSLEKDVCDVKCKQTPPAPTPVPAPTPPTPPPAPTPVCDAARAFTQCGGSGYSGPTCCPVYQTKQQVCWKQSTFYSSCCTPGVDQCPAAMPMPVVFTPRSNFNSLRGSEPIDIIAESR